MFGFRVLGLDPLVFFRTQTGSGRGEYSGSAPSIIYLTFYSYEIIYSSLTPYIFDILYSANSSRPFIIYYIGHFDLPYIALGKYYADNLVSGLGLGLSDDSPHRSRLRDHVTVPASVCVSCILSLFSPMYHREDTSFEESKPLVFRP